MAELRKVGITARPHPMGKYAWEQVVISIDGVTQAGRWQRGEWQLPANRAVPIVVAIQRAGGGRLYALAELVLPPGGDIELEYLAPAFWTAPGALGPLGTVQRQGSNAYAKWVVFAAVGSVLLVIIALGIAISLIYLR